MPDRGEAAGLFYLRASIQTKAMDTRLALITTSISAFRLLLSVGWKCGSGRGQLMASHKSFNYRELCEISQNNTSFVCDPLTL